jgi:2-polyprenyl-3-methyl-5-hydroxy-6-metoxy-1,4-benzoquinol methylase
MKNPAYTFAYASHCDMCGERTDNHKILGQRLNVSQGFTPRKKKGITTTILRCNNCSLVYSNPQPIPLSIQDHYGVPPEEYWKPSYFKTDPDYFLHEIKRFCEFLPFNKGMKALDIGAGLGKSMIALKDYGFEAYGLEPSISFHKKAVQEMNIDPEKITLSSIEEAQYPENFFHFITFGAVLEHLYQPSAAIIKALKWLQPGGLMHLEVPSADYLVSTLINLYYSLIGTSYVTNTSPMHSPYHLYEFTPDSFAKFALMNKTFEIIFYEYFVCSAAPFPGFMKPILTRIMNASKTGMQLSVWLRKK